MKLLTLDMFSKVSKGYFSSEYNIKDENILNGLVESAYKEYIMFLEQRIYYTLKNLPVTDSILIEKVTMVNGEIISFNYDFIEHVLNEFCFSEEFERKTMFSTLIACQILYKDDYIVFIEAPEKIYQEAITYQTFNDVFSNKREYCDNFNSVLGELYDLNMKEIKYNEKIIEKTENYNRLIKSVKGCLETIKITDGYSEEIKNEFIKQSEERIEYLKKIKKVGMWV